MVVKIRLSRFGKKRQPFYNIVVSQARYVRQISTSRNADLTPQNSTARDSKPMEVLGTYDPTPRVPLATDAPAVIDEVTGLPRKPKRYKNIQLDQSRTKYWLGVGAQPSEPIERLLCLVRLLYLSYGLSLLGWPMLMGMSQIGLMEPRPGRTNEAAPPPTFSATSTTKTTTV
jgi:small subunit ribosomal protein S16